LGLLDVDLLAAVGAGSDNTVTLAQAQIRAPSDPGYEPTAPPAMTTPAALALLEGAGYKVEPNTSASAAPPPPAPANTGPPEVIRGRISKDGQQLSLVIGVAANDPTSVAVANTAADRLRNVGIAATVMVLDPATLYHDALNDNRVDAIVGWHQAGGNLATRLAARYGCPALESTQVPISNGPVPAPSGPAPSTGPGTTSTTPASPLPTSTPPPSRPTDPNALVQAPSNLTGICDRSIQSNIDAALNGTKNINEVITAVEPRLWNMSTVLPILQDTTIVAAGPSVQNVSLSGAVPVGIVGDAGQWIKTGP
jgi:ABC-type transport system substrate-binding protein